MNPSTTLTLTRNGNALYIIVLPTNASPAEKRAARELRKYVKQISGAELSVQSDRSGMPAKAILLGTEETNRLIRKLDVGIKATELGDEGFVLRTVGPHLVLGGGRPRGALYAVYAFLEDVLGCRWYTARVSHIPKIRTIKVGPLEVRESPAFENREPFYTEAWDKDWAARNRCNGTHQRLDDSTGGKIAYFPFVHSFNLLVPAKDYFSPHPEYYSEIGGKRIHEGAQLCLSNPDVTTIAIAQVNKWLKKMPDVKMVSVSQNDCGNPCACEECRKAADEEGAQSGPLLRFVNRVAEGVARDHPDKLIDTLAYQYTEQPPRKVKPAANVRVRLAPINNCFAHPIDTCPQNAAAFQNLQAWSKITNNLYIWHYNTNFANYPMPFPDFDELQGSTRAYQKLGVKGIFFQGAYAKGGGGEFAELRSWVLAKLLWDPQRDVWTLVDEFLAGVYGNAAKPIREYMTLLHDAVKKEDIHFKIYDAPTAVGYLRKDLVDQAEALFEQAEKAVADQPDVLDRVRKARLSIDYVRLQQAKTDEEKRRYAPIVAKKVRKYHIGEIREGQPSAEYLKSIEP